MKANPARPLAEPKPIFWIPLKDTKPRECLVTHESFKGLNGYLDLEVKVQSDYLYVGSGSIRLNERDQAYYAFARRDGKLVVPATGMKGAVRSVVEALSCACVSQIAKGETTQGGRGPCKIKKDQEDEAELCPACSLFGTTGYGGRVHFTDAVPLGDIKPRIIKISDLWPPRRAVGRKFYQAKAFQPLDDEPERNHRFVEAVPKDSVFGTRLFFENTSSGEMGLLVRALGIGFPGDKPDAPTYLVPIKIGGAKPRCMGAVRFVVKGIQQIPSSKEDFFSNLSGGGKNIPIIKTAQEWLKDKSLLDEEAWSRFCEEAKSSRELCPKEMY